MANGGRILYAVDRDHWVFRFEGGIQYTMTHTLDAFLERAFAEAQPRALTADLRDTTMIDSTGIGLLVKLAHMARAAGSARPLLFCTNPEVTEILDSVCLDKVYTLVSGEPVADAHQPMPATSPGEAQMSDMIEGAHRLLSELSESNRVRFEGVLDAFERQREGR